MLTINILLGRGPQCHRWSTKPRWSSSLFTVHFGTLSSGFMRSKCFVRFQQRGPFWVCTVRLNRNRIQILRTARFRAVRRIRSLPHYGTQWFTVTILYIASCLHDEVRNRTLLPSYAVRRINWPQVAMLQINTVFISHEQRHQSDVEWFFVSVDMTSRSMTLSYGR